MNSFGKRVNSRNLWSLLLAVALVPGLASCGGDDPAETDPNDSTSTVSGGGDARVVVHQLDDPDRLNPITNSGANSTAILFHTHQRLLCPNFKNPNELIPVLAQDRPVIEEIDATTLSITYQIRPEAKWDNGEPVTGHDVAFTMKAIKNPKMDTQHKRPYLDFIKEVNVDEADPKKVQFICDRYIRAEYGTGAEVYIVPEYAYDPNGLMKRFTVRELTENGEALADDPDIIAFADDLNSEKWQREVGFIVGSGAYEFTGWETGARINLVKKADWWGNGITDNHYFEANAPEIVHQIVTDPQAAISALKSGKLDVYVWSDATEYKRSKEKDIFIENFDMEETSSLIYSYFGINMAAHKFSNKSVRQGLAHLVDYDRIINRLMSGYGDRTVGPVMPSKDYYNNEITPYAYDPSQALALLKAGGVEDLDGDGSLDYIDEYNDQQEFTIDFSVNQGNAGRLQVIEVFKEECAKIGIEVNIVPKEWSVYLDNIKAHDFDMYYGAWVGEFAPQDPTQLWHTSSANGGSNYPSFGNADTDKLIEEIAVDLDDASRRQKWFQFQEIIHDEVPYVFLAARQRLLSISKRFDNTYASPMDPGHWEAGFQVK